VEAKQIEIKHIELIYLLLVQNKDKTRLSTNFN